MIKVMYFSLLKRPKPVNYSVLPLFNKTKDRKEKEGEGDCEECMKRWKKIRKE